MVETVLQLIMQMAGGTAAAAGTEVGQAISTMVRDRLAVTARGPAALRAVEARPDDPAAVDELRTLLQAEVDADPDFAERLATALADARPAHTTTGSITFQGTTVRGRNVISLGSVTIRNTRTVRLSLLAAALVFVALVALGTYGGAQLIIGDDPPVPGPTTTTRAQAGPGSDSPREETTKTAPTTTGGQNDFFLDKMSEALLDHSDVPEGWVWEGWTGYPPLPADWPCDVLPGGLLSPGGAAVFVDLGSGSEGMRVSIRALNDLAEAEYALSWHRMDEEQCLHGRSVAVTPIGDETVGYQYAGRSVVYIRDGTYLIGVETSGDLHGLTTYYARKQYEKFMKVFH